MWAFRKGAENLKAPEHELLKRLFCYSRELQQAYSLREEFTEIFEVNNSKDEAKDAIEAWCKRVQKSGLKEFESFLRTLENWLDEITNYFLEGWTRGACHFLERKLEY